ncbi:hypothetical protein [Leptospira idonii]|uniref:Uncharacterized protein n=1 Tax=Leptospira idonii TaxID=1193500 RepID=A0A4R9LWV5_9LEPT|nr:hypothetical protein [Leptospira idonii]TGN18774.1 hypothetical protein EHS15_15515 [Leptospira idonii]
MNKFWGGSAKKMLGHCLAVGIFISEEGSDVWTEEEKKESWANLEKALAWLTKQAEEYGVTVQFETHCPNWEEDIVLEKIPGYEDYDPEETKVVVNEIASQLGYDDITAMYHGIKEEYEGYNIHFMFFANADDRAHMSSVDVADEIRLLEYNMLYRAPGEPIDSFTFAHESLHAYSAMDLYNVYQTKQGAASEKIAKKRFESEVMLVDTGEGIEKSELSEFTAFLVGWHDDPKSWYAAMVQPHDEEAFAEFLKNHQHFDESGNVIIEEEEEVLRYSFEEGTIVRYTINGSEDLIHWRRFDAEGEEEYGYWESYTDENYYCLTDKNSAEELAIPFEGGMALIKYSPDQEYEDWLEVSEEEEE